MMSLARKGDAPDMRSEASVLITTLCGVTTSMNSVNRIQQRKQFRCLPASKCGPFQYVEIITSMDDRGNYRTVQQLVEVKALKSDWANFYFRSANGVKEQ